MDTHFRKELFPINNYDQENYCFWEDFLTENEINLLLARPEWIEILEAQVIKQNDNVVDEEIRISKISWLYADKELKTIWDKLSEVVNEVNRRFFHFDLTGFYEPMQLGLYSAENKGHYNWHTDMILKSPQVPRKLSMSLLLSSADEFEGGSLQIKSQTDNEITLECKRGRAWFFPSYILHRVTPVTKGIRRSLVLWVGGPPFK